MATDKPKQLDFATSHQVEYCIPLWVRDEQVKLSITRIKGRIAPAEVKRTDPIAVCCFGPSLADTWEEVRAFKYVISCSGAHKFLVERGLVPTWHCEVDPRPHKVKLIGPPHEAVEYLMASTCHQEVFDHLEGFNVKLWHVFATEEEAMRILPATEWALTGGSSVGLRAMTIARFLGFTDQHIFGMDGCEGKTGKHAAEHPNQPKNHCITTYEGVEYRTTTSLLECAKQTFHELDMLQDVRATFRGEGLVQAMARRYQPKPAVRAMIGFNKPELISKEYLKLNAELHRKNLAYGIGGSKHAPTVRKLCDALKTHSVLDYGCGKGFLAKELDFPIWEYDPAIPEKSASPRPADIVVCTDVLEHIEPAMLRSVLKDLKRCVKCVGYFVIHTGPSNKALADGRNSHLIQKGPKWWMKKLEKYFTLQPGSVKYESPLLTVVLGHK